MKILLKYIYLLYQAAALWMEKGAGYYSAAFSYYAPLALVPLLFFTLSVTGFIYGEEFVANVFSGWGSVLGNDLVQIITTGLDNFNNETQSSSVPFVSGLFFLSFYIIALNAMSDGFSSLWGREQSGFHSFMVKTVRATGFLLVLQFYTVVVIAMEFFVLPIVFDASAFVSSVFLFVSTSVFFTFLYRWLVVSSPAWISCIVGSIVSSLMIVVIKTLVDLYVFTTPVLHLYGAAGLILMLFVWVYILAVLINYGAAVAGLHDKMTKNSLSNP